VIYGQGFLANASASPITGTCSLDVNGGGFGAQNGGFEVTIPAGGQEEASNEGIAHLTAPGIIHNTCTSVGTTSNTAVTAIKVNTANP
jgi:hypothetical protein